MAIIILVVDSDIATVNGTNVALDVSAKLLSDRVLVSLRFIAESFNLIVNWDSENNNIILSSSNNIESEI